MCCPDKNSALCDFKKERIFKKVKLSDEVNIMFYLE